MGKTEYGNTYVEKSGQRQGLIKPKSDNLRNEGEMAKDTTHNSEFFIC